MSRPLAARGGSATSSREATAYSWPGCCVLRQRKSRLLLGHVGAAGRAIGPDRAGAARASPPRFRDLEVQLAEEKKELKLQLQRIGWPQAVLPGEEQAKSGIDLLIRRMEALTPVQTPLQWEDSPGGLPTICPLLVGDWELAYASNGTVVTRTAPAQFLLQASQLPGTGLSEIEQVLTLNAEGQLCASNSAVFGFGPLGSWRVGIEGVWRDAGDGKTARVLFNQFSVRPVAALGLPLPAWLPPLQLGAGPGSGDNRTGADWVTTFVDSTHRVGRGKTGNTFLFVRKGTMWSDSASSK